MYKARYVYSVFLLISTLIVILPLPFITLPQSCYYVGEYGGNVYKDRNLSIEGGSFVLLSLTSFVFYFSVQYLSSQFLFKTHFAIKVFFIILITLISTIIFSLRWIEVGAIYLTGGCSQVGGIELGSNGPLLFAISKWLPLLLLLGAVAGILTILTARKAVDPVNEFTQSK